MSRIGIRLCSTWKSLLVSDANIPINYALGTIHDPRHFQSTAYGGDGKNIIKHLMTILLRDHITEDGQGSR